MALETRLRAMRDLVDVKKGLISREIFVDEEIYQQELEQIFARCWLFVGFEDQVKKPGDYFVSRMGEESVILSRDRDNTIHVFLNSCRHRGMKVCRYDEGNTPVFTCPYQGWSYAGDGSLVGVPRYKDAYREELDKSQWGLVEVAQLASFKGTIWATWDSKAPSFEEYIGDIKPYLGMFYDKPDGSEADLEVLASVLKWTVPSNWKWGAENFTGDHYHNVSHRSVDLLRISPSGQQGRHTQDNVGRVPSMRYDITHHGSSRGAGLAFADVPYTPTYPNNPIVEEYYRESHAKRQQLLGEVARLRFGGTGTIFPNGTTGTTVNTMCVWQPNGPDHYEQWRWYMIQRDAPQEVKDLIRHYLMRYGAAAGMTEQDDMENWNYAHKASKGTIARRHPYAYKIGLGLDTDGHPLLAQLGLMQTGGRIVEGERMQNLRGMYDFWATMMDAESWDDLRERKLWP